MERIFLTWFAQNNGLMVQNLTEIMIMVKKMDLKCLNGWMDPNYLDF